MLQLENESNIDEIDEAERIRSYRAGKKKISYTVKFKREIVRKVQQNHSIGMKSPCAKVASEQKLDRKLVNKWVNDSSLFDEESNDNSRKRTTGRPREYSEFDDFVQNYAEGKRAASLPVTGELVALELKRQFSNQLNDKNIDQVRKMVYRIFERTGWANRRKTNNETILDEQEMGRIHLDFVSSFWDIKQLFDVPDSLIINMDETPIYYDPEVSRTFEKKGKKKVSIKRTTTTNKASALLSVTLDGKKLRPLVIFKAQSSTGFVMKQTREYDQRNAYCLNEKGFCDSKTMIE